MTIRLLLACTALAATAACAVDQEAAARAEARDLAQVPPATPVGEPINCLQTSLIQQTYTRGDRVIDFRTRNNRIYRNTLPQSCPGLGFDSSFSYRTTANQLCAIDTITVLRSGASVPGLTCGLGEFQQVELTPSAD